MIITLMIEIEERLLKAWRKRQVEAEVGSVVHIFTSSAEIISTEWIMLARCVSLKRKNEKLAKDQNAVQTSDESRALESVKL